METTKIIERFDVKEKGGFAPDTDVLLTHGPPYKHGDRTAGGQRVGCGDLFNAVERVKPRLHVFEHIHEDAGGSANQHTTFAASYPLC